VILGLLALVGTFLAVAPSASAAPGTNTSWSMVGDYDDSVTRGQAWSYDSTSGIAFSGTPTHLEGSVDGWTVTLEPAAGDVLAAGRTYDGATRWPFQEAGHPGEDLSGQGRGCNTSNGSFTIHEITFDASGDLVSVTLSLTQLCDAVQTHAYASIAWHSATPAPPLPAVAPAPLATPTVSVHAPDRAAYGEQLVVQATLTTTAPDRTVQLYSRVAGGQDVLVAQGTVDPGGHLAVPLRLTENTTLTVRFHGTGGYADAEAHRAVQVQAKLHTALLGGGRKAGRFRVFHLDDQPSVGGLLKPGHTGDCLRFRLQLHARGHWGYDGHTKCLTLNENSAVSVRVTSDPRLLGIPIRVRPQWKGDDRNPKVTGRWVYLEFVR